MNRRRLLLTAVAAALAPPAWRCSPARAADGAAENRTWHHGLSLMGEPRYESGFAAFSYVRPDAPKAGTLRLAQQGTFDNFNLIVAGVKGELEAGIGTFLHDTLMTPSDDEVGTTYGLIAESASFPEDRSSVTYRLRPEATFSDGSPITAADVIFSFEVLKTNSPSYSSYYATVTGAEATGPREVTFRFAEAGNRELPQIVGELPILPKAWWTGRAPDGRPRDPTLTTLEAPLGSGPYRLLRFEAGRYAVYGLNPDYWARDLPVNRGRHNFAELRFDYFRDGTVLVEAFKADAFDYRAENSARAWSTSYDIPAVAEGRIVREEFPVRSSGVMQGFAFNLRRPRLADARVRRAFNLAFDFEDTNRTLMFGLYTRVNSYFFGTELASSGLPEGREREILETLRGKVPDRVFTTPYANPVNGNPEAVRTNLREAVRLLGEAGYELKGRQMVAKATAEPLRVEFLEFDANIERVVLPYRTALERIGVGSDLRVVDPAQYQNRLRAFDFDVTTSLWAQSLSPGNEQREFWGSEAADRPGSRNVLGIKDAAIDALIDRIVYASDRAELVALTRALDRVLLSHDFVVPQWSSRVTRTLRWNRFGRPDRQADYGGSGFPSTWWYDAALAARTGAAR